MRNFIWVRWKNGQKDTFEVNDYSAAYYCHNFNELRAKQVVFTHPKGSKIYVDFSLVAAHTILYKHPEVGNPLNDDQHYDDPLN